MADARAQRAALEGAQAELRRAREQLAIPLDVERLRREVGDRLDRLAQEGHALDGELRGIGGLQTSAESARLWLIKVKTERKPRDLANLIQVVSVLGGVAASITGGVFLGRWLERSGMPPWLALALCLGSALVVARDLAGLGQWLKR